MPRIKRDVRELKNRAINSLVLGIELFNRPHDQGRAEGVLIFLHHAFEMLLKAAITNQTGTVHTKGEKYSYGFDKCLEVAQNQINIISSDERLALSILDTYRDLISHYYMDISEDLLYIQAQAAVTLFDHLLSSTFTESLADKIPERILPVSIRPPRDLQILIDGEFDYIDTLLEPGKRKGIQATARLRSIMALATTSRDDPQRASESKLRRAISRRRKGEDWKIILPEVAQLTLDTEGEGTPISLRIKKDGNITVRITDDDNADATLLKQEVNIWDKYNLGRNDLAKKLNLSGPRTSALILELKIQEDPDCFKVLRRKSTTIKGYSMKALRLLQQALNDGMDIEAVWQKHGHNFRGRKK